MAFWKGEHICFTFSIAWVRGGTTGSRSEQLDFPRYKPPAALTDVSKHEGSTADNEAFKPWRFQVKMSRGNYIAISRNQEKGFLF